MAREFQEAKAQETMFGTDYIHPAYGTIQFTRKQIRPNGMELFGSSIKHNDVIALTISHAKLNRDFNSDHISPTKTIIEVEMSQSQFAEAITSFNVGSGVPVTICYSEKDGELPMCSFENKRTQFKNEFDEKMREAQKETIDLISQVETLFNKKKTLNKSNKEDILSALNKISQNIGCNAEFVSAQFERQINKTIAEAKGEIEAFMTNKMLSIAQQTIVENDIDMNDVQLKINENPISPISIIQ